MRRLWIGPALFFSICFVCMLLFTENDWKQSLWIAGVSAGAGLMVNWIGYRVSKKMHSKVAERRSVRRNGS